MADSLCQSARFDRHGQTPLDSWSPTKCEVAALEGGPVSRLVLCAVPIRKSGYRRRPLAAAGRSRICHSPGRNRVLPAVRAEETVRWLDRTRVRSGQAKSEGYANSHLGPGPP